MYRILKDGSGNLLCIHRESDNAGIPKDEANADYQAFKAWNNAQQTPLVVPDYKADTAEITQRKQDIQTLRTFMQTANGTATNNQRDAVIKAFVRLVVAEAGS